MNLKRSISLAGVASDAAGVRERLAWAVGMGYAAVALDASVPGTRPRELDRSGRRELAALLKRHGLRLSGLDLWVPRAHLAGGPNLSRAVEAVRGALGLAADLATLGAGRAMVSIEAGADAAADAVGAMRDEEQRVGAVLADHAWPPREGSGGVGIDPAAMLSAGAEPVGEVLRLPAVPASARLSDSGALGRVPVGGGRLDVLAYEVSLVTRGYAEDLVVDLRGLKDMEAGASAGAPTDGMVGER